MPTQENWRVYLTQANEWMNQRFPHFSHKIRPDFPLDNYVERLSVEFVDGLLVDGHELDSMLCGQSLELLKINAMSVLLKSEGEKVAIAIHETAEGYGVSRRLYSGYGFNIVRPEHDYAEFIETHYRRERGLPRCPLELSEEDFELMRKMDDFYRKFPIWHRYIGDMLYLTLLENPNPPVDENLRLKVLEKCRFD